SGLTRAEIEERWPDGIARWNRGEDVGNGAEDRGAFRERMVTAIIGLARSAGGPTLVVTHGAAVGAVEAHLDVHPGVPLPKLAGRWLDFDDSLRAVGDRFALVDPDG
ncbi:MAG: histidine phosphatase family protein, partial [Actinomycetota bacterium]